MSDDIENGKNLDLLVKIADAAADYIKDNEERAYAIIKKKEGHKELYPLRSKRTPAGPLKSKGNQARGDFPQIVLTSINNSNARPLFVQKGLGVKYGFFLKSS